MRLRLAESIMSIAIAQLTLELHTQEFVDSLAGTPPIYTLSPADARSVLTRAQYIPVGKPSAQVEELRCRSDPQDRCRSGSFARLAQPKYCQR